MVQWFWVLLGAFLIFATAVDTFGTILLPRTVKRRGRLTSRYFRVFWNNYSRIFSRLKKPDLAYAVFGPLSIIGLILIWTLLLLFGFAFIIYGLGLPTSVGSLSLSEGLYVSGVTIFTLGFGDIVMQSGMGRCLAVAEAGVGFGFLAVVISYLPVLYSTFSRRELLITIMDAHAGSPPSGGELIRRYAENEDWEGLREFLQRWEFWAGEFLETHLSYPGLVFYRSQHSDTSWLTALTAILDACCIIKLGCTNCAGPEANKLKRQAMLTYAMGRHALIDLGQVISVKEIRTGADRLNSTRFKELAESLSQVGWNIDTSAESEDNLQRMRSNYEPVVKGLAWAIELNLPDWMKNPGELDNWQTSAYDKDHL